MRKLLLLMFLTVAIMLSASVYTPNHQIIRLDEKYGLSYRGELCIYPIYDSISLVTPFSEGYNGSHSLKSIKQQVHQSTVAKTLNIPALAVYTLNGKKGLLTQSQRLTEPIYDDLKVYRRLRSFKKSGDQIIALAIATNNTKKGVIDLNGDTIIPLIYKEINPPIYIDNFNDPQPNHNNVYFYVRDDDGTAHVIDINNNTLFSSKQIPSDLYKALPAIEKKNNKDKEYSARTDDKIRSIVNAYNKALLDPLNNDIYDIAKCKPVKSIVFKEGTAYGVKNATGDVIIPPIFDRITKFNHDGVAEAIINDVVGYVNEHGFISFPYSLLSFNLLVAPYDKTMNSINQALDVYPTNTYVWLAAGDYLLNSHWAILGGKPRNYSAAADCYEMALSIATDRDEMYLFTKENLADADLAKKYATGKSVPLEEKIQTNGWALVADLFNSITKFTSTVADFGNPTGTYESFEDPISESDTKKNNTKSVDSARHGSISASTAKNSDSRTYSNYETQLIKMKNNLDNYSDSRRQSIQSKMKKLRKKWEDRGFDFYHSDMEDWRP